MGLFIDPDGLDWIPLLFLLVVYGYILYVSSNMISDGSELLLLIKSVAGIVGSVVLPVLGAVPDGAIVLFSGLGPGAQQQLSVGVGALAGSTIMLLTLPWLLSVVAGRVDVGAKGDPVYHKLPRLTTKQRFSLSTGVLAGSSVATSANIMLLTAVSFVIIQVPAFVEGCGKGATEAECLKHKDVTKWFALVGLVVCVTLFVWYLYKQVRAWRRSTPCSHALHRPPTQTSPQPRLCLPRALGPQVVGNNVVGDAKREQRIERAIINQEISAHAVFAHMIQQSIRSSSKLLGARHDEKEMRHVLNHMFDRYDSAPRDQQLDKAELRQLVNALHGGTPFSDEDYDAWFESLDRDGDGQVSRPEFVSAMKEYFKTGSKRRGALTPVGAAQVRQRLQGAGAPGVSGANGEAKAGADVEMANAAQKSGNGGLHVGTGSAGDTGGESEDEDDSSEEEEEEEMPEDLVGLPHHVQTEGEDPVRDAHVRWHRAGADLQRPDGGRAVRCRRQDGRAAVLRVLCAGAAGVERVGAAGQLQLRAEEDEGQHHHLILRAAGRRHHEQHLLPGHLPGPGLLQGPQLGVLRRDHLHRLCGAVHVRCRPPHRPPRVPRDDGHGAVPAVVGPRGGAGERGQAQLSASRAGGGRQLVPSRALSSRASAASWLCVTSMHAHRC